MTKPAIALLFILAIGASPLVAPLACAGPAVVDLNQPGAVQALARDNPDHYAKVRKILADVSTRSPGTVPQWMTAEFGARDVSFPWLLKTSDPAKRSLSFTLDRTRYEAVVQVPTRWRFAKPE
jgi:hypothetical protein